MTYIFCLGIHLSRCLANGGTPLFVFCSICLYVLPAGSYFMVRGGLFSVCQWLMRVWVVSRIVVVLGGSLASWALWLVDVP